MTTKYRLAPMAGAALLSLTVTAIAAAGPAANRTQLPSQVIPTGEEDAVKAAPAAAARSLAPAAKSAEPSAAELEAQLIHMTSESTEGLTKVTMPNGSTRVDLDGRFMSVMVATPNKDGGYDITCQTGDKAVDAAHAAEHPTLTAEKMKALAAAKKAEAPKLEEK